VPLPLSYLFVPGTRPDRFAKALASGAGAVIIDLEDAVAPKDKVAARRAVIDWLAQQNHSPVEKGPAVYVRINDAGTPWYAEDLAALQAHAVHGLMLPKCESASQITHCLARFAQAPALIAIVESARGVQQVDAIAVAPGLQRLAFGTLDYAVDLDLPPDSPGLAYAAARIAIASRAAGLATPVAGVTPELDTARVRADMHGARGFGFAAKLCIHPMQVAAVHDALQPTQAELAWAQRVLAATSGQSTAVQVDGRMVDRPVVLQAQAILDRIPFHPD